MVSTCVAQERVCARELSARRVCRDPQAVAPGDFADINLGFGGIHSPLVLAQNVNLRHGYVSIQVPSVFTGNDYSLVRELFGFAAAVVRQTITDSSSVSSDSGDWSQTFTIIGPM